MTDTAEVKTANMETSSALPPEETERLGGEIVAALKTVFDPEIPADIYEARPDLQGRPQGRPRRRRR